MSDSQQHSGAVDSMKLNILTKHERTVTSAFLTPLKSPLKDNTICNVSYNESQSDGGELLQHREIVPVEIIGIVS